ncbi:hypothetical protein FQA39_LY12915 [Lamprigera yunnana]|nr:hypothetical protein FQA39_LY12915 [Lamprigera yunnana]
MLKQMMFKNFLVLLNWFASNSLRSDDMSNAVGTLKEEMRMLDSLIIKAAEHAKVPAGGQDDFYFFDAVAPIIEKDSINFDIAFRKNRYEKGETQDYINCPMTKEQYDVFYNELIKVEAIAKRGENTLLFGPMKPQGLTAPNGVKPYAVVQLRQDNASDTLYNLVGFQTNLK